MKKTKMITAFVLALALALTACAKPTPVSSVIESETSITEPFTGAGTEWRLTSDNSYIVFNSLEDSTYIWTKNKDMTDDNYNIGIYGFFVGPDAFEELNSFLLVGYGVSEDDIRELISTNEEYSEENFVCLILMQTSMVSDGEEQLASLNSDEALIKPFYGFLLDNETTLVLTDMQSGHTFTFLKQV